MNSGARTILKLGVPRFSAELQWKAAPCRTRDRGGRCKSKIYPLPPSFSQKQVRAELATGGGGVQIEIFTSPLPPCSTKPSSVTPKTDSRHTKTVANLGVRTKKWGCGRTPCTPSWRAPGCESCDRSCWLVWIPRPYRSNRQNVIDVKAQTVAAISALLSELYRTAGGWKSASSVLAKD